MIASRTRYVALFLLASCSYSCVLAEETWPQERWESTLPKNVGMEESSLRTARNYALTGGGSGIVIRHGKVAMKWGDQKKRYDLKSTTKSIGVTALGLAIADGKIKLQDKVVRHHPNFTKQSKENRATGWIEKITIGHLATQTAGFEKPGGYTKLIFEPGTKWSYSDGGPNWLAECMTLTYEQDVDALLFKRLFTPLGISRHDLVWRKNSYRDKDINGIARREFGSGISANVDAMARIGYLYLRRGKWNHDQLVPEDFVDAARTTVKSVVGLPEVDPKNYGNASDHYGLLWWNNADGTLKNVPRDAYWSWGLHESLILVVPSLDIVVARAGKSWKRSWNSHYDVLAPFFDPIVASVEDDRVSSDRARSSIIKSISWAPASSIIRKAHGGDNWPTTWADDDTMYTAFGDGRGFKPYVPRKLSMGLCRVTGTPSNFQGINVRSSTFERIGDGKRGPKVSSLLMVGGVLYAWVRNTGNAQLAWSNDRGARWNWADWKFETSFGYPAFLNYGQNYEGTRDKFVYIYSHDAASAYDRADRMVLARVPMTQIKNRGAYEFLQRMEDDAPVWTRDIKQRGPVFEDESNCYRSSVSFNSGIKRYLWCQTGLGEDTRREGGFAIYDAPKPWGPWTTVFRTEKWDVGPGETSCLPTKWMSADGLTMHLVFSGDDYFSVRKATLTLHDG